MWTESDHQRERHEARVKWQRDERSRLTAAWEEGYQKGRQEGYVVGRIQAYQVRLRLPMTPEDELFARGYDACVRLAAELEAQLTQHWPQRALIIDAPVQPPE